MVADNSLTYPMTGQMSLVLLRTIFAISDQTHTQLDLYTCSDEFFPQTTLFLSPLSVTLAAREAPVKVPAPHSFLLPTFCPNIHSDLGWSGFLI